MVREFDICARAQLEVSPEESDGIREEILRMFGGALNIRELDSGACNGCEPEITALTNPYYDLERFGIHFVASRKHADMLMVKGPVTRNMLTAVKKNVRGDTCPETRCGGGSMWL